MGAFGEGLEREEKRLGGLAEGLWLGARKGRERECRESVEIVGRSWVIGGWYRSWGRGVEVGN